MITIRCDYVDDDFRPCSQELSGLAFNAKPANWAVVDLGHGDHMDYCPEHRPRIMNAKRGYAGRPLISYEEWLETLNVKSAPSFAEAHRQYVARWRADNPDVKAR